MDALGKIYFFTDIRNLTDDKITHRWGYKNKVKAEISFNIKGKHEQNKYKKSGTRLFWRTRYKHYR